jgi:FkbM family methyltransferase
LSVSSRRRDAGLLRTPPGSGAESGVFKVAAPVCRPVPARLDLPLQARCSPGTGVDQLKPTSMVLARLRSVGAQVLRPWRARRLCSDRRSAQRLRELLNGSPADGTQEAVELRLRALDGHTVTVRPGSTDAKVVWDTFRGRYHLPPPGLTPATIWDLGSNIGMTVAHFAALYPGARVIGVELDAENASLCERNVAPYGDRCEILNAAVWDRDGEVPYSARPGGEYSTRVGGGAGEPRVARAISLDTLAEMTQVDRVDFVKMDIEGAEARVLGNETRWTELVRCIKVEVHKPYTMAECVSDLEHLGFRTAVDPRYSKAVTGIK